MKYYHLIGFLAVLAGSLCFINAETQNRGVKVDKVLDNKVHQLMEISMKRPLMKFNGPKFKEFVRGVPRNYSFVVVFTALAPQRECVICRHVYDELTIVASSYKYTHSTHSKLFFAFVDFDEGGDVFQLLRLNTAPVIMHFPSKGKPKPADTMDFQKVGINAEAMVKWIQERTDIQIRIFRPANYSSTVAFMLLAGLCGGFVYLKRKSLDFIYNKTMWAIAALIFCFTMISGQMWNQIRGPPFLRRTQNGGISYVQGSSHGQYVFETYIVMALNAAVVVGMILMVEAQGGVNPATAGSGVAPKSSGRKSSAESWITKRRRFVAAVGLGLVVVFFSLLLSVFRSKSPGYPYSFLFK